MMKTLWAVNYDPVRVDGSQMRFIGKSFLTKKEALDDYELVSSINKVHGSLVRIGEHETTYKSL